MALFRFFFAPVLLAAAVIAGRVEKARAPAPTAEVRVAPAGEREVQDARRPSLPPAGRAVRVVAEPFTAKARDVSR